MVLEQPVADQAAGACGVRGEALNKILLPRRGHLLPGGGVF